MHTDPIAAYRMAMQAWQLDERLFIAWLTATPEDADRVCRLVWRAEARGVRRDALADGRRTTGVYYPGGYT